MPSRRGCRVPAVVFFAAVLCAACTEPPSPAASRTTSPGTEDDRSTSPPGVESALACPEVTGQIVASKGSLKAFSTEATEIAPTKQAKVWINGRLSPL